LRGEQENTMTIDHTTLQPIYKHALDRSGTPFDFVDTGIASTYQLSNPEETRKVNMVLPSTLHAKSFALIAVMANVKPRDLDSLVAGIDFLTQKRSRLTQRGYTGTFERDPNGKHRNRLHLQYQAPIRSSTSHQDLVKILRDFTF
jgi:hypothetical protein